MPSAEEIMGEIREAITGLQEQQAQLSELLTYKLENPDNPSALCEAVLSEVPACQDFSGVRRWSACEAWRIMEEEKVTWQEAIKKAWEAAHAICSWGPETPEVEVGEIIRPRIIIEE